jgi:hypothetical protein
MTLDKGPCFDSTRTVKKLNVELLCQRIRTSWQWILLEVMVRGFKKFCISDAVIGMRNDISWEDEEDTENVGK